MTFILQMTLEANLLLGKLYYYEGSYQSALNVFENAHLENISMATCSTRLVHIIAESYAVKGKRSPWQPVLLDWFTLLQRVTLSKVRDIHGNLFCKTDLHHF